MDLAVVFHEGDWILIGVFASLLIMSALTWYLILAKSAQIHQVRRANRQFLDAFWEAETLPVARERAEAIAGSPLARLSRNAFAAVEHFHHRARPRLGDACGLDEFLVRTLRNGINR